MGSLDPSTVLSWFDALPALGKGDELPVGALILSLEFEEHHGSRYRVFHACKDCSELAGLMAVLASDTGFDERLSTEPFRALLRARLEDPPADVTPLDEDDDATQEEVVASIVGLATVSHDPFALQGALEEHGVLDALTRYGPLVDVWSGSLADLVRSPPGEAASAFAQWLDDALEMEEVELDAAGRGSAQELSDGAPIPAALQAHFVTWLRCGSSPF